MGTSGLITPSLGLAVLVLAGSAAIVAGGLSWQIASSSGGDTDQAREAAEEGYNRIIDLLNDPGNSYLLVTKWVNWTSNNPVTAQERQVCKISSSTTGAISDINSIIQTPTRLPSVGNGRQVRYKLESFTHPQYPGAPRSDCTKFGNLAGGTAELEILGQVLRNGSVIASHRIERAVMVEAEPDTSGGPEAPPLATLGTGGSISSRISVKSNSRISIDKNANWSHDNNENTQTLYCLGSASNCPRPSELPASNAVQTYSSTNFLNLFPASPPYPSQLNGVSAGDPTTTTNRVNFPYTSSSSTLQNSNLKSFCRVVTVPTQTGSTEQAIGCKISSFTLSGIDLVVHTDRNPVPVILYLSGTSFEIKENGNTPGRIVNKRFADTRTTNQPQNYQTWNALRIYGDPNVFPFNVGGTGQCDNNGTQVIKLVKGSSINGAFLWVPKGEVIFDSPQGPAYNTSSRYGLFGAVWACKLKLEGNAVMLSNGDPNVISSGIDAVFGIVRYRYSARGVARVIQ